MAASQHVNVRIDLSKIRANATDVRRRIGAGVALIAVVKANAYGLGIDRVAPAIADLVDEFCVFNLQEAAEARLHETTGKSIITLCPAPPSLHADDYRRHHVRPVVIHAEGAARLRDAAPLLCVDTGMQRFACPPGEVGAVLKPGHCRDAFTHATKLEAVQRLIEVAGGRGLRLHAAGTTLLDERRAHLDAVRPGLALYRGAVRVSTPLVEVREASGPAGYTGFTSPTGRHGVVLAGYAHGLRNGPCRVNGRPARVLEVGMQSAFVTCDRGDKAGDEVVLLGDGLTEDAVAADWNGPPQLALIQLAGSGVRTYVE